MRVGGYTLDLYCDNPDCPVRPILRDAQGDLYSPGRATAQFFHEFGSRARALARKAGWKLAPLRDPVPKDLCPTCNPKKKGAPSTALPSKETSHACADT